MCVDGNCCRFRGFFVFLATGHHFNSYMPVAPRGTRLFSRYNLDLNRNRPLCTRSSSISSGISPCSSVTSSPCSLNHALPRITNEPGSARGFSGSGIAPGNAGFFAGIYRPRLDNFIATHLFSTEQAGKPDPGPFAGCFFRFGCPPLNAATAHHQSAEQLASGFHGEAQIAAAVAFR